MIDVVRTVLAGIVIGSGVVVLAASVVGLLRLPDVFTRAHAVAKAETLGLVLVVVGLAVHPLTTPSAALRLVAILLFALVGSPTAVHAITRAAHRSGVARQRGPLPGAGSPGGDAP